MLQTYEAVLEPNGQLHFTEAVPAVLSDACRVLATFTQPIGTPAQASGDWRQLAGSLRDSPNLNGDPLASQQEMRHEGY